MSSMPVIVVGNKVELASERKVGPDVASQWASSHGFTYAEVSACTGHGIKELFDVSLKSYSSKYFPHS